MFLVLISKGSRNVRNTAILSGCLLSFLACVVLIYFKPSATFLYWTDKSVGADGWRHNRIRPHTKYCQSKYSYVWWAGGVISIAYSTTVYSYSMLYPGIATAIPVGGAALLIWSGQTERTASSFTAFNGSIYRLGACFLFLLPVAFPAFFLRLVCSTRQA